MQQENADYTDDDEIAELPDATSGGGSSLEETQHAGAFRVVHSPPQIKPRKFVRDIR
jgi:hypothetical protein